MRRSWGVGIVLPGEESFEGAAEVVREMVAEGGEVEMGGSPPQISAEDHLPEKGLGSLAERKAQ